MSLFFKLFALLFTTATQLASIEQRDITVKHVVKPGENLYSITRSYLGTDILWKDNWQLNPHIQNPNQLKVGEELIIISERIIPAEKAKVLSVINRVEKKSTEGSWSSAANGDVLIQQEGVRTYEKSSALLEFNEAATLKVSEFSQIFLQSRETNLTGVDSATIEVVKGDAELSWAPLTTNQTDITIVSGSTISKPETGKSTALRTGLTDSGKSVISVYQGNSSVASAGSEVMVKQGMGVAVKPGQAPSKPKPLLRPPKISSHVSAEYTYTNPLLQWESVANSLSYIIEICADMRCQKILKQHTVKGTQWQITDFNQAGNHYFRLGAVSNDEVVGYRTQPRALTFSTNQADVTPPLIAIEIIGKTEITDKNIITGANAQIEVFAFDEHSGVSSINYRWDDGPWISYDKQAINIKQASNNLDVQAIDKLGLTSTKSYTFE